MSQYGTPVWKYSVCADILQLSKTWLATVYLMTLPKHSLRALTLFDMGFFLTVSHGGGGMRAPHHNFVVIAPMIMKFGTGVKLDVFYTMVTKIFVTSLLLRHYDVITCILADP